jgi:hypothetical protein
MTQLGTSNSDLKFEPRTGLWLKFYDGDWVVAGQPLPYWQHRRILGMNLLSRNKRKNESEWEIFLDCGHSVVEICEYDDAPRDLYRDCDYRRKH